MIPFLEAWDPDQATSMAILRGMPAAGADLIEIGMPFTDPMADGPILLIIQAAGGKRGLKAGVKVRHVLTMVREFREADAATPVILMGYLNPIICPTAPRNSASTPRLSGVDAVLIIVDPAARGIEDMLLPFAKAQSGLDFIRLVAPTTDDARLPQVMNGSSGFVYYVAITGITGTRSATSEHLAKADSTHPESHRFADRGRLRCAHASPGGGGFSGRGCGGGGVSADRHAVAPSGRAWARPPGCRGDGTGAGAGTRGSRAPNARLTYEP